MKKYILSLLLYCAFALTSLAYGTCMLDGVPFRVDTLFHNQVGPGTTQTSLWFHNDNGSKLRVFYCTIDMTNPYVSLSGVCATDHLAGNERVTSMAERKSRPGKRYFAGINADFFVTSGYTARGVSRVGSPVGSTVVEGQIYRARNNATLYKNFIVDKDGKLYVDPFFFGGTLTTPDGTVATLGGINTYANESAASNKNKITIYNDLYYGSTDETGAGAEVLAVLVKDQHFETAKPFQMMIAGDVSTEGDMLIPSGCYVIHGHGTAADVVSTLQQGDVVTISPTWTAGGVSVEPQEVISGNPKILENGVVLESEGDRGDASAKHPRSGVGFGDGGNKVYFLVVDGRSSLSEGVRTRILGQIMKYAGATDAMNVDGGGSSTLYTSALGIRNRPSDGSERADGNAFFAISSAPDDDVISQLRFADFKLEVPKYGLYTPRFYGYNQYGMLIDSDVQGVTLTCPEEVGHIKDGVTFFADGSGSGEITGHYGDITVTGMMNVGASVEAVKIVCDSIITDTYRDYIIDVESLVGEEFMPIDPAALNWVSDNPDVVIVDNENGSLRGLVDGEAIVTGQLGEMSDALKVIVQKPTARYMPIDPNTDPSTWKITQSGGKNGAITPNGDGFIYTYTGASGRAPKITLTKTFTLWSLPDTLRVRVNPGEAPLKNMQFGLRANGSNITYVTVDANVEPNKEVTFDVPTKSWTDVGDMSRFPIMLQSVIFGMNNSTTGTEYEMRINDFETVYSLVPPEVKVFGDVNGDKAVNVTDVNLIVSDVLSNGNSKVYDLNGDGVVNVTDVNLCVSAVLMSVN